MRDYKSKRIKKTKTYERCQQFGEMERKRGVVTRGNWKPCTGMEWRGGWLGHRYNSMKQAGSLSGKAQELRVRYSTLQGRDSQREEV